MSGAGNQVRTGDLNLGKVALYQLSYSRMLVLSLPVRIAARLRSTLRYAPRYIPQRDEILVTCERLSRSNWGLFDPDQA